MSKFLKQLLFVFFTSTIILAGGLAIYSATPSGNLKIQVGRHSDWTAPVAWWKMDEASWNSTSGEVRDSIGSHNGTSSCAGACAQPNTTSTSVFGMAGYFDGTDDYLDLANGSDLNLTAFSISVWFYSTSLSSRRTLLDKRRDGYNDYYVNYDLQVETTGALAGFYGVGGSSATQIVSNSGMVATNQWYHGTLTYDGSNLKLYLNGVLASTTPSGGTPYTGGTHFFHVGQKKNETSWQYPWKGYIDDVRIYNYALTADQVKRIYSETAKLKIDPGATPKVKISTGLVGYWKLDENDATAVVKDYSGKNNNGTTTSSTATSTSNFSTTTAMIGRAMSFDGTNDWVSLGSGDSLDMGLDSRTYSMWFRMGEASYTGIRTFIYTGASTDYEPGIWLFSQTSSSTFTFRFCDTVANIRLGKQFNANKSIYDGQWHFLTLVINRNVGAYLYIDGVASVSGALDITVQEGNMNDSSAPQLGKNSGGTTYWFNGLIDEVKIWNYARTAEQIWNSYKNGLANLQ